MPRFTLYRLGVAPETIDVDGERVTFGRDVSCDVVLQTPACSRLHAVVERRAGDGRWVISPVRERNPVVVDGFCVSETTPLRNGAEIQLSDYLVHVGLHAGPPAELPPWLQSYSARCSEDECGWEGEWTGVSRAPSCPSCGGRIERSDVAAEGLALHGEQGPSVTTDYMEPRAISGMHQRVRVAKRARLDRLTTADGGAASHPIDEAEVCAIGRKGSADVHAMGIPPGVRCLAELRFEDGSWRVTHVGGLGRLGKVLVNDEPVAADRALSPGDVLQVGRSRFRLTID